MQSGSVSCVGLVLPSHVHQRIRGPFIRSESAIMNVRVWLGSLGLGQYEKKFRDNKIDLDVLADLTDGDLEELGVPLGDRRRLLRAIAELAAHEPLAAQARPAPAAPASAPQSFAQLDSAERRPITVMFCDLVGLPKISSRRRRSSAPGRGSRPQARPR